MGAIFISFLHHFPPPLLPHFGVPLHPPNRVLARELASQAQLLGEPKLGETVWLSGFALHPGVCPHRLTEQATDTPPPGCPNRRRSDRGALCFPLPASLAHTRRGEVAAPGVMSAGSQVRVCLSKLKLSRTRCQPAFPTPRALNKTTQHKTTASAVCKFTWADFSSQITFSSPTLDSSHPAWQPG